MPNGSKGHEAAFDISVLSVGCGSEADCRLRFLGVCFRGTLVLLTR